jgi:hypothetical protein
MNYVSGKEKACVVASNALKNMRIGALPQPAPKRTKGQSQAPQTGLVGRRPWIYRVRLSGITGRFFALNRELSCAEQGALSGEQGHFYDEMGQNPRTVPVRTPQSSDSCLTINRPCKMWLSLAAAPLACFSPVKTSRAGPRGSALALEIRAALASPPPSALPPGQRRAIRNGKSFSHFDGESRLFQR